MAKKKKGLLLDNQDWLDDFIPVFVDEMSRLDFAVHVIARCLARIFYSLAEIKE